MGREIMLKEEGKDQSGQITQMDTGHYEKGTRNGFGQLKHDAEGIRL